MWILHFLFWPGFFHLVPLCAGANRGAVSLTNFVEKSSYPVEFVFFRSLIVPNISASEILVRVIDSSIGVPRYFLNSVLLVLNLSANFPPYFTEKFIEGFRNCLGIRLFYSIGVNRSNFVFDFFVV